MEMIRDLNFVAGFRFEHSVANFPLLTYCGEAACGVNHLIEPHRHFIFQLIYIFAAGSRLKSTIL